jgi:serine/threonine-protein kinase
MPDAKLAWIGKYRDLELLGEGAMGVVYKAVDSVLDRPVAIKVMSRSIARQGDLRKRFLREAQAAASLQHPNVVCVHDFGDVDGQLFIAMEFVDGVDLESLIDRGHLPSLQAKLDVAIDVLHGLAFAHKRGIVHRDIKPANIRVDTDGRAKIMDFGVAHLVSSSMTTSGAILGTPSYMAPEQIAEGRTSPVSDIFSIGAVLYQLVSSVRPFDGANFENLRYRIVAENPRPLRELIPEVPGELDRIVSKAMAKEPTARYTTAADMASDLSALRSRLGAVATADPEVARGPRVGSSVHYNERSPKRRTLAYSGGAILAATVLAAIVWSQLSQTVQRMPATEAQASTPLTAIPAEAAPHRVHGLVAGDVASRRSAAKPTTVKREPQQAGSERENPTAGSTASGRETPDPQQLLLTAPGVVPAPSIVSPTDQGSASVPTPSAPTTADLTPAVEAYARAIESRSIGAVRSVQPGLTSEQQRGFEQFFQVAQNINVRLRVADVTSSGAAASARLVGRYDYVNSEGRDERQPISVAATLRYDGNVWRLVSVR